MKLIEPRTLSGFMELMPEEQIVFNKYKKIIEETYEKYSFYPLDTPVIEYANVLLAKAGGETEKQIYRFKKGDNDLALRFDLTVPLAKYVAARQNELIFPFKRYQIGKVYRGERAQKGRFREFYQCDIDVIGDENLPLIYDAQIPAIISEIFEKMNIGKFKIRINNRKILTGFFESLNLENKIMDILRIIDKIDKIGIENIKKELLELNIENVDKIIDFINIKENVIEKLENLNIVNETFNLGIKEMKEVVYYLDLMKVKNYYIDLTIARGLDYYTGTIYETFLTDYPEIGSISSGGRYENLAGYYTDKKLPGVGMSIGLTRLFYKFNELGLIKENKTNIADYLIVPMDTNYEYIFKVYNKLRDNGKKAEICLLDKSFKSKMKYANRTKIPYVIIIGENEINTNTVVIKNMQDGTQTVEKIF